MDGIFIKLWNKLSNRVLKVNTGPRRELHDTLLVFAFTTCCTLVDLLRGFQLEGMHMLSTMAR